MGKKQSQKVKKRNGNLKIFVSLMASALTIAWALIFREYIIDKIQLTNIFGIDTEIYLLAVIGAMIFMFTYLGWIKK